MDKKKVLFIINPHAGTGKYKKTEKAIYKYLDTKKFSYIINYTQYKNHAYELATNAVDKGIDIIIAVGGDGTISEIVNAIVHTNCVLGIIPVGSGNGLANHLHISKRIKKAIKIINENHMERIDTVRLNEYMYASIAGAGFDAFIANRFDDFSKRGIISYLILIFKYLFIYKSRTYIVRQENTIIKQKAFLVCFANSSQWGFNVRISPESSVQDGYVNVCFIKKPNIISLPFFILFLFSGNLNQVVNYVKIYKLKEFSVETEDKEVMHVHIDGDPIPTQYKLEIKTNPLSLHILLPNFI
ncbi:MAG: YegS/Rv2252/BmrU family lipid kinase [Bacteroidales bacterium]|jgi:YegS/Rv2252/BmrU family lipid kinase|nr:YegS/Rv2252/BmrU family lipid kinase [Bacteroidales bacterium]MDD2687553.1 YegS/Rv2252/BmrU family lipid kinase [Bacteroidales bacterium]MDD3331208.1 YegS/Rv2252/BmrU family lipid kinase [Bacteroidales bacterium]MDD3691967.1 YegS/Rv2252/BmrU family lipid kinase [Bacteroidales bacterium]MDD4045397.1 YegS/Rv2252/BmrU family lipid kinase [Bacteroidales bacterium]